MKKLTFIDLFAGCGGLSEGFMQTGHFEGLAHVEWEGPMVETLRNRLISHWSHTPDEARRRVVRFDIQKTNELLHGGWSDETQIQYGADNSTEVQIGGLDKIIGNQSVDVIIGGPPCQAYSLAGRAQDPNSMKFDYRNYLFESFVKIVDYYKPRFFVFENVPGLLSATPGNTPVRHRIYEAFKAIGYEILDPEHLKNAVYSSVRFNTPQDRKRVIIFGVREGDNISLAQIYEALSKRENDTKLTVHSALADLPKIIPLATPEKVGRKNVSHRVIKNSTDKYHIPRYHNPRDIKIFKEWLSQNMNQVSNQEKLDYYTKITGIKSNHIKYRALEWDKPSPTIVSHLYKDGLMFIHPDIEQLRSITIREAALLQTFPKDFEFLGSNAYCFKMIGNAVPVAFAKEIGNAIIDVLNK